MSVPSDAVWGSTRTSTGEGTRGRKRRRDTHGTRSKKRCGLRETQHDEGCSCSQDIVSIVTATARVGRSKRRRDDKRSTIRHGLRSDIVVETGNLGFGDEQTTASQVIAASVSTHTAPHIASAWPACGRRPRPVADRHTAHRHTAAVSPEGDPPQQLSGCVLLLVILRSHLRRVAHDCLLRGQRVQLPSRAAPALPSSR